MNSSPRLPSFVPDPRLHRPAPRRAGPRSAGFTRADLLCLLAVAGVLMLLQWTALARNRRVSHAAQCAENFRHLMLAWRMYTDDHAGKLVHVGSSPGVGTNWVSGWLNFAPGNSDNTNELYLLSPQYALIGPYVDSARYFRCPDDLSTVSTPGGRRYPRVRSVSINAWAGGNDEVSAWSPGYKVMYRAEDIAQPAGTLVLLEEHPDSINDGAFFIDLQVLEFLDMPAAFHDGGMNAGMADGHVEFWIWADNRTMPPNYTGSTIIYGYNEPDLLRLQAAATYRP